MWAIIGIGCDDVWASADADPRAQRAELSGGYMGSKERRHRHRARMRQAILVAARELFLGALLALYDFMNSNPIFVELMVLDRSARHLKALLETLLGGLARDHA